MTEPFMDFPDEPFDLYLGRVTNQMHVLRTQALGKAYFYLTHDDPDKALEVVTGCRLMTRCLGEEIEERRMIEAGRPAGATWEEVIGAFRGRLPVA